MKPIICTTSVLVAVTVVLLSLVVHYETHKFANASIVGKWTGKPTSLELQMQSDMNSSDQSMLHDLSPKATPLPTYTEVADDWEFDPNGAAVNSSVETDSHGKTVTNQVVSTYVTYGDYLIVNYQMSISPASQNVPEVNPMSGTMRTRYRIKGNTLTFLPLPETKQDQELAAESCITNPVYRRVN